MSVTFDDRKAVDGMNVPGAGAEKQNAMGEDAKNAGLQRTRKGRTGLTALASTGAN